ncbi:hypothetical protein GF357_05320 [Candidatus Dojkabacteria bacterium]|nr:hypothetical protein [Candidatus Dojkabacteria bacterium]
MKILSQITEYIGALIKDAFSLLSGVIGVVLMFVFIIFYDASTNVERIINIAAVAVAFSVAPFNVWRKQREKSERLKDELSSLRKNPVNYKFEVEVSKLTCSAEEKYIKEELKFVENEVETEDNELTKVLSNLNRLIPSPKEWKDYKKDLTDYHSKLKEYCKRVKNIYHLNILLTHIGHEYDENITVKVIPKENVEFTYYIEGRPTPPDRPKSLAEMFSRERFPIFPSVSGWQEPPYYQRVDKDSAKYEVTLRDLKVEDSVFISSRGWFIETSDNMINLTCTLRSSKTKNTITKELKIKLDKEIPEYNLNEYYEGI